jgi:hypothetical protein
MILYNYVIYTSILSLINISYTHMILFIFIFIIILVLYIHLLFHWKVSNDIDIPHITLPDKDTIERVADSRQPFLFEKPMDTLLHMNGLDEHVNIQKQGEAPLSVPHKAMLSAIKKEPYISYNNTGLLDITQWIKESTIFSTLDTYLKPPMCWKSTYDIIYGNGGVFTDLQYSMNNRYYICVLEGPIDIKLCPPKTSDVLGITTPSKVNIWSPNDKDKQQMDECDTILLQIQKGSIFYIPAHWWYSIQFSEFGCVMTYSYTTYMNTISHIPSKLYNKYKIEF